jgi:hypothetical protein
VMVKRIRTTVVRVETINKGGFPTQATKTCSSNKSDSDLQTIGRFEAIFILFFVIALVSLNYIVA